MAVDAEKAFVGTVKPEGADKFDEAKLTAWMDDNVEGFEGPITVGKFAGGQSNPTYRVDAKSGSYVLRRKPMGKLLPSAHAVDREFKVISGLHPTGFPVAKPYGLCTDDDVIGSMFYIMDMVEGRTIWNGALPDSNPEERRAVYLEMIDTLGALHNIDVEKAGLSDFGKPGNYFGRQISRWTKQYKLSETEHMPEMERLIEWLPATMPEQNRTSVVHGDYRIDNMIFARESPEILALLDWELSTLGHPLADLAYQCMHWRLPNAAEFKGLAGIDRAAIGLPTEEDYVAKYCERRGTTVPSNWNFYLVFSYFRFLAIVQGVLKRALDGNASNPKNNDMIAGFVALLARDARKLAT